MKKIFSLTGNFENDLQNGISIIEKWLPIVNKFQVLWPFNYFLKNIINRELIVLYLV